MAGVVAELLGLVWSVHVAGLMTLLSGLVAWKLMRETHAPSRTSWYQADGHYRLPLWRHYRD